MGAFMSFFVVYVGLWATTLSEGFTELLEWPDMLIFVAIPAFVFWLLGRNPKWNWEFAGRFPLSLVFKYGAHITNKICLAPPRHTGLMPCANK
jgi:hypothetical protein